MDAGDTQTGIADDSSGVRAVKILFVTSRENDYLAATLWDGLRSVVHGSLKSGCVCNANYERPPYFPDNSPEWFIPSYEPPFDLMVLNACFLRDHDWHWPHTLRHQLKLDAKIVYVEGWDDAHEVHDPMTESNPPFPVDVVFRRELDPEFPYPYRCEPLGFGAPKRWFTVQGEQCARPWDVFCAPTVHADAIRWDVLSKVFQTKQRHRSLVANPPHGAIAHAEYLNLMRQSKLCICPTGGARCDCLRTYEAAACGCIPVFVGYPLWRREPWFESENHSWHCHKAESLPEAIDRLLSQRHLVSMSQRLIENAREHHTTRARALKLLKAVGMA